MANGWTPERKAKQAELIRNWQPWKQATGPKTEEGKARVARNGWKGGKRQLMQDMVRMVKQELKQARDLAQRCGN